MPDDGSRSTRPANIDKHHGMVNNMIVLPARAPIPTATCCAATALAPSPENNMMAYANEEKMMRKSKQKQPSQL
jgi:hypothetical protein